MIVRWLSSVATAVSLCIGLLVGITVLQAAAPQAEYAFHQAAMDLPAALEAFSKTTKLDVLARGDFVAHRRASALHGEFSAAEALSRLLAGTGLSARFSSDHTVVIVPKGGTSEMTASPGEDGLVHEVVVTAYLAQGYVAHQASSATRLVVPLRDIPQTVNVVSQQLISDRAILRPAELADSVPGVRAFVGYGGISSGDFYLRGFGSETSYRNGFKDFSFLSPVDFSGIERVEFLKGPASVLYGEGKPGGVVNYLSKRPSPEPLHELSFTAGSGDLYRSTLDLGGPLLPPRSGEPDPALLYRWNAACENAGGYRDYNGSESLFLAPSLTWHLSPDTTLTLLGEYHRYDYVFDRGLLAVPQALQVPGSRFLGEPENFARTNAWRMAYELTHKLNDVWQLRSALGSIFSEQLSQFAQPYEVAADGRTVLRQATARHEHSANYTLQNEVSGSFRTGQMEHQILAGVELGRYEFEYEIGFEEMASIDFFAPVYAAPLPRAPYDDLDGYGADSLGLYLQDQVTLSSQWKLLLGLRHDTVKTEEVLSGVHHAIGALSPRLGLVYQPWDPVSLFAGWSRSFTPNFGISAGGESFKPEEGEQMEGGIRLDLLEDKLAATLSVYEITKENVLAADPFRPEFVIATGEQKSRGMEFELAGSPAPGWNVALNYAYTDAFVSRDSEIAGGTALPMVPRHQAGLWASYEWQSGPLKGFGLGTGFYFASARSATLTVDPVILPSSCRWDAALFYKRENWSAQVNFKNLTSERIYQGQGALIYPDPLLQIQASLTLKF